MPYLIVVDGDDCRGFQNTNRVNRFPEHAFRSGRIADRSEGYFITVLLENW